MQGAAHILDTVFGFSGFRPGQQEIVEAVESSADVLAILPTGAGKSLCFQLPALMREGVTVVISPLIALMEDQVAAEVGHAQRVAVLPDPLDDAVDELLRQERAR